MLSLRFVLATRGRNAVQTAWAWGLITIAKSMGKVKANYRQITAGHNAGNKHMWYPIAVKSLERNSTSFNLLVLLGKPGHACGTNVVC